MTRNSNRAGEPAGADPAHYAGVIERTGLLESRRRVIAYGGAVLLALLAIGLRRWLDVLGPEIVPFTLFYPVVLACALLGGIGPGLVAVALTSAAATMWWIEPVGLFSLSPVGLVNLVLYLLSNTAIITVAHLLRTSYRRLRQSEARLSLSQDVGQIGIWDLDLKTGGLWWSPAMRTLTGIAPGQPPAVDAILSRIHPADRERVEVAFDAARCGHDRFDVEFRFNRDDGRMIWLAARAELFRDAQGTPSRLLGINFDATPRRTIESERDRANSLLHTFFDSLPGAAFAKDREGRYLLGNPIFAEAVGHGPEFFIGKTDLEVLGDDEQARVIMANDQSIIAGGEIRQLEESLLRPDGEPSFWLAVKAPFKDAQGQPQGLMGISLDVTEMRKAQQRLRFLADEIDHRAKNLLGVVQAIVRLTKVEDVAEFKAVLTGRIRALGRAHGLLAASRWDGVDLATLVREELAPFDRTGADPIRIEGPSLMLAPNASQALAMVLHELAINAARFGALSAEGGKLAVTWQIDCRDGAAAQLELAWTEVGAPRIAAPAEHGFGFTAMLGAIEHQLAGDIGFEWGETGVTCRIAFPVERNLVENRQSGATAGAAPTASGAADRPDIDLTGMRVLIVDDEALIALGLRDAAEQLGCTVIGPAHATGTALALVRQRAPDLAILDINLAGTSNAPIARALKALGIPFIYCTGYAEPAAQIAPGLEAEVIAKPTDLPVLAAALRRAAAGRQEPPRPVMPAQPVSRRASGGVQTTPSPPARSPRRNRPRPRTPMAPARREFLRHSCRATRSRRSAGGK